MRNFFFLLFIAATFTYCTTMESGTGEPPAGERDGSAPEWFNNKIDSASDSTSFYGFSLASASDSSDAVDLSTQMALNNLRFEIDRFAETVREQTEETTGSDKYTAGSFVLNLRNTVQNMDLTGASVTHEHANEEEGVHHHFSRAEFSREDVINLLSNAVNDNAFRNELQGL